MKRPSRALALALTAGGLWAAGCAGSPPPDGSLAPVALAQPCGDAPALVYQAPANLAPLDDSSRGDVVRCGHLASFHAAEATLLARDWHYRGDALPSGVHVFRIAYRTTRAPADGGPAPAALAGALVLVPEKPTPGGPVVVYAHGAVGLGEACAPSRADFADVADFDDFRPALMALAASGWTVIAPDYAGFGFGGTSGFFAAEDEARSVLDATRAAAKILPAALRSDRVVLVGHSQGGHAVLAAHAYAGAYGLAGNLAGVAAIAPLWISQYVWGAIASPVSGYTLSANPWSVMYSLDYFYAHGQLYDGADGGLALFRPELRPKLGPFFATQCAPDDLAALGNKPADFFAPELADAMAVCGVTGNCTGPVAQKWATRFSADRPGIDPHGAPISIWLGGLDTNVTPGFARCIRDKLTADLRPAGSNATTLTWCFDATANHNDIVRVDIGAVSQWIGARVGLGGDPGCVAPPTTDCPTPPPNL